MDLLYEVKDGVATLTLNRPEKLNAVTDTMREALAQRVQEINRDPAVRVAVVRGAGSRAFSAGSDIYETTGRTPVEKRDTVEMEAGRRRLRSRRPPGCPGTKRKQLSDDPERRSRLTAI